MSWYGATGIKFMTTTNDAMEKTAKVYVAGHRGLVGSALVRALERSGYRYVVVRPHSELELTDRNSVSDFFAQEVPDYVLLAAAKVGGILANSSYPADFVRENLTIQTNVIDSAYRSGVKRLIFLGSSCIYPRLAPQPIKEEYLLTGALEPTNRAYALAKIAGIEMCWAYNRQHGTQYLAVMPTNLYGPGDNYDLNSSHVIPALVRKIVEAKASGAEVVPIWGSGMPRREFLHSDDMAEACLFLMNLPPDCFRALTGSPAEPPLVNIGCGEDLTIRELAAMIAEVVGFRGGFEFDCSKPDGTPRKLLDVSKLKGLGWRPRIELRTGLERTVEQFLDIYSGGLPVSTRNATTRHP